MKHSKQHKMPNVTLLSPKMKLFKIVNKAIKMWVDATGVDPDENIISMSDWDVHKANESIRETQDIDTGVLSTFMMLRSSAREFAAEQKFDSLELLEKPEKVLRRTAKLRALLDLLNNTGGMEVVSEWQADLKKMAKGCGLDGVFDDLIDDVQDLAYIRRDALRAFKELRRFHFSKGDRGKASSRYNKNVIKFWNMNSIVRAAKIQPEDGISMVMVRDPVDLFSFFCFLVVNGSNITILTDQEEDAHPMHKYMSRSRAQEKGYESRAYRLRFPYELFDFEFDDKGEYHGEKTSSGLVRTNTKAVIVKPIRELDADEALWAMMMFDLLREEYWNQEPKKLELSYTGEGTVALPASTSKEKALVIPGFKAMAPLARAEIHRDNLRDDWEIEPTGQNNWMEDRYAHLVPDDALNVVGAAQEHWLVDGTKTKLKKLMPSVRDEDRSFFSGMKKYNPKEDPHDGNGLIAVEPTSFGTPEVMEKDRKFVARYNQATIINVEARREFNKRKREIKKWFEKKVKANLKFLLDAVCKGTLISEIQGENPEESFDWGFPKKGELLYQMIQQRGVWDSGRWSSGAQVSLYQYDFRKDKFPKCHLTKKTTSVWSHFSPMTPISLAVLAGCKVEELPDVLKHWYLKERYDGNCILDRIDPLEWRCENPWRKLSFDILIGLSKRKYNSLLKERGIKRKKILNSSKKN